LDVKILGIRTLGFYDITTNEGMREGGI
jgi:hypothetical protein